MSTLTERRVDWAGCQNARDLGGLPTKQGTRIRPGALIRTDNHDRLTLDGQAALLESRVSLMVDLRSARECARFPSPFRSAPVYRHLSLQEESEEERRELSREDLSLLGIYLLMLDRTPHLFARVIAAMADAPAGTVVVHCHAGKDRTGVIVALALRVAGVSPEVIAQDYALTDECLVEHYAEELANIPDEAAGARWQSFQHSRLETMLETLTHLDRKYGGAEAYLLQGGVTPGQLSALRARLCEDSV